MTKTMTVPIDTRHFEPRYTTIQSDSDQQATGKCVAIRVYAVTVHDGRADVTKWDVKAWLVEEIRTSRWQGEEAPIIDQELVIGKKMPTPRVQARFGDADDTRNDRSRVEHLGTVSLRDGVAVLWKSDPSGNLAEYALVITG